MTPPCGQCTWLSRPSCGLCISIVSTPWVILEMNHVPVPSPQYHGPSTPNSESVGTRRERAELHLPPSVPLSGLHNRYWIHVCSCAVLAWPSGIHTNSCRQRVMVSKLDSHARSTHCPFFPTPGRNTDLLVGSALAWCWDPSSAVPVFSGVLTGVACLR